MKRRWISLLLTGTLVLGSLAMSGCGNSSDSGDADTFSWWIVTTDGDGTYYDKYEDHPGVQWLNNQYWDVDNHTLGEEGKGENIKFTFQTPIAGSETDNFNTMIGTGEYTDLVDLSYYTGSIAALAEDGVLMDITEYVEEYMPDYVALLDEHPAWKSQVTTTDADGNVHYYYLPLLNDGPRDPWDGFVYRRDWVVKYAEPTEYVWDWDSAYVQENGHPAVTPLEAAVASGNLEGWKANEVTEFTANPGDDPDNTYTDNVIFPSVNGNPLTISDWEWMFEAFDAALEERGYGDDSDAYCITIPYQGYFEYGDLVSSFGGGNGYYYINDDGEVTFDATSDNFKTYLECMNTWNDKGWLDTQFETRSGDLFYMINQSGFNQGKVGMWEGMVWDTGTKIRTTCMDASDQQDAFVMGCAFPINDMYGTAEQMYHEPDAFYGETAGPATGGVGITTKAEDKNLPALFTYLNWCYTREGALLGSMGLSQEQYESMDFDPDNYAEYGFTDGLYHEEDRDGVTTYVTHIPQNSTLNGNAFITGRLTARLQLTGTGDDPDYDIDNGESEVYQACREAYGSYDSTGNVISYATKLTDDENEQAGDVYTPLKDYMNQVIPRMIKNGVDSEWDEYVKTVDSYDTKSVCEIYQKYVDEALGR